MSDSTNIDDLRQNWEGKTGELPFPMTNDYLFRAVCQKDNQMLQSLICAIFHWEREQVVSAEVTNPIQVGQAIDDKEYILDVNVRLNNSISVNLEMQVMNEGDWTERSLQYLCRRFDQLHKGQSYSETDKAVHIGILNFDPFHKRSKLLGLYQLTDRNTDIIYTEKFQLYVLCLPRLDQAGQEDTRFHTDLWAQFFLARTWEELQMLAKEDKGIHSAVTTSDSLLEDEEVRARMQAREDYYYWERVRQARRQKQDEEMAQTKVKLEEANHELSKTQSKLTEIKSKLAETEGKLTETEGKLTETEGKLTETEGKLTETEGKLTETEGKLTETEGKLTETEKRYEELRKEYEQLRQVMNEK